MLLLAVYVCLCKPSTRNMAAWVKFGQASDGTDATAFVTALGVNNDEALEALLSGPKGADHMLKMDAYVQTVQMEIQMSGVMGDDDKEAAAHLKVLKAYVEMSSFTAMLSGGVPVEHVHDLRNELGMHLQCAQEILQERRDDATQKNSVHPLVTELVHMEVVVASALANIEHCLKKPGNQNVDLVFVKK